MPLVKYDVLSCARRSDIENMAFTHQTQGGMPRKQIDKAAAREHKQTPKCMNDLETDLNKKQHVNNIKIKKLKSI